MSAFASFLSLQHNAFRCLLLPTSQIARVLTLLTRFAFGKARAKYKIACRVQFEIRTQSALHVSGMTTWLFAVQGRRHAQTAMSGD